MSEHQTAAPARYFALIPAAGIGMRMAADGPKQYLTVGGKPMLSHTLAAFLGSALITHTYVVVAANDMQIDALVVAAAAAAGVTGVTILRCGGATRMDSVLNALVALRGEIGADDWVLVHDAARPGLTPALIAKLIAGVGADPVGGLLALPVVDTVKHKGEGAGGVTTLARAGLWLAQTPQMFRYKLLSAALDAAQKAKLGDAITDDASAVEAFGLSPKLIEGHPRNLKVTLPADIEIAEMYLAST